MMSPKRSYQKGKRILAFALSVFLCFSFSMMLIPLDVHAETEEFPANSVPTAPSSEQVTPNQNPAEPTHEQTVPDLDPAETVTPITLTHGGLEIDPATAFLMNTDTTLEDQYPLAEVNASPDILAPGSYQIYLHDEETGHALPIQGTEILVTEGVPISYSLNYFCARFYHPDGVVLFSKQYAVENTEFTPPAVSLLSDYEWQGWALTQNGAVLNPLPAATSDITFYGVPEELPPEPSPEHIHSYSDEWAKDDTNHWHPCIAEDARDQCDEPTKELAPHESDEGTVTKEATTTEEGIITYRCTVCGHELRTESIEKLPEKPVHTHSYTWKSDTKEHWQTCTSTEGDCDTKEIERAVHSYDKGTITKEATESTEGEKIFKCETCGYTKTEVVPKLPHTHKYASKWTTDDTSHWHVCACGTRKDVAPHKAGSWITDKAPTVSAEGSRHKECTTCKKVLQTEAIPKLIPPKITAGIGQIFHHGSTRGITITCSGSLEKLTGVYVNNEKVHPSNYSVTSGSTILTLHPAYLESLAGGTHTVKLAYSDGTSAETQFTIQKTTAVKTGDTVNSIPLIILLILSGGVLIVTTVIRKRGSKG